MTLTPIASTLEVRELPSILNANFSLIETNINLLLNKLDTANSSLKLVSSLASVPQGGVGASNLILIGNTGIISKIIKISGITQTVTYSCDVDGNITSNDITSSGDITVAGFVEVTGIINAFGGIKLVGILDITEGVVKNKYESINVVSANTGASAANPIDPAGSQIVFLNYDNSGNALGNAGAVKLVTANLTEGQIIEFHCTGTNVSGQSFYNGTSGNEIFAYTNPGGPGFTSISNTVKPSFNPGSAPDTKSWMRVMWMDIGSGVFRLVVLDSKNVDGVS